MASDHVQDPPGAAAAEGALVGRHLASAVNSPELLEQHAQVTGGKIRTRFPPEPNGYLHVGHAKSMHMNFKLAFEKLEVPEDKRQTIFRYDDTNPEAESQEYIQSLREDVEWLGWKPIKTTYSSDYFQQLYEFAVQLIKEGKAYVCHQTKDDIAKCREVAKARAADPNAPGDPNSPWRDRPVEENLELFEKMKQGQVEANTATLRLKMDMTSANPNMWDQVAYRIKFMPHPHAGEGWCIYPTYDYTHCIVDSLEHVDYSICTLEFETRRESYYWLLQALNSYRPKVYEFARLNITFTLLSKRKLLKLVVQGMVRGWDDPRMPTIKGLRRRGYTPDIINAFCQDIGVTRNDNVIEYERLQFWARSMLNDTAPRCMAALEPLKVVLTNVQEVHEVTIPDLPFAPEKGSHTLKFTPTFYIEGTDFRLEDSSDYFGLAPGKAVGLKYAGVIRCDEVVKGVDGKAIQELRCTLLEGGERPKGNIGWVPEDHVRAEVRVYNHLFTVENPDDKWEEQINPESEVVMTEALVDASVRGATPGTHFQFERAGFYVVDKDSCPERMVFNRTVTLKESGIKKEMGKSRKAEQDRQRAEKEAKAGLAPQEMFKGQPDLYSQFDDDGVPTHDGKGEPLSKSSIKKLRKDWEKQKKLFAKKA